MTDSILVTLRNLLGIEEGTTAFDLDIITALNATLMTLNQLGIGPDTGLFVSDESTTWSDVFGLRQDLNALQQYVYLKVRLLFDPPATSTVQNALRESVNEIEWRLGVQADDTYDFTS